MKVKELIELLQKEDPERIVVMSTDEEGNNFQELYNLERANYSEGEIDIEDPDGEEELDEEADEDDYEENQCDDEEEVVGVPAIVLWP